MWITLNEPNDDVVTYQEGHHMLLAHALAWHAYDREFRPSQGGQVGGAARVRWRRWRRVPSTTVSLQPNGFVSSRKSKKKMFVTADVPQVSLVLHMDWVEPAFSFSREDVEPAKRVLDFSVGWFAEPIFGSGDYPLGMRSWLRQLNFLGYRHFGGILKIYWKMMNDCV